MKKGIMKKFIGFLMTMIVMIGMALPVAAEPSNTVSKAEVMTNAYYTSLEKAAGENLTGTPSLTIKKYVRQSTDATQPDTTQPIEGVEFKYAKVGELYQLTLNDKTTVMAYGVTQAFATAAGLTKTADYMKTDGGSTTYFFKNGETIQNTVQNKTATDFDGFLTAPTGNNVKSDDTDSQGTITANLDGYGLYLVVEYDVTNAKVGGKAISITKTQAPFVVALPTSNGTYWNETVVANVKNSTGTADVEKKIVVGNGTDGSENKADGTETVDDTDTTSIGDTVHFRLKGDIISIPDNGKDIVSFELTDQISKGLSPILDSGKVKIDAVRIVGDNTNTITTLADDEYEVSTLTPITSADAFNGGQEFTISVKGSGLSKLTQVAKNAGTTEKAIYFYYSATVNENAVIGPNTVDGKPAGNPNQVKLEYQVDGNSEMATDWDKVTEFTFGIDVTKQLEGEAISETNKNNIQFIVYSGTQGSETYYRFSGSAGDYHTPSVVSGENNATKLSPKVSGQILIKGLDEGTYYLKEVATVAGYNLLKEPVEFTITAEKGENTFVGNTEQYLGTIANDTDDDGYAEATVINTEGFTLPSTGGAGIWMFVIGGAAVIAMGCLYFGMTRRKRR